MSFPYEKATFWMLLLLFLSAAYAAYKANALTKSIGVQTDSGY